ncbi:hypothetical protein THIARS_60841 [Thiomonas delicata]|uniref:Uncharacterized protein n=1 Tax=Thiomonas delicata TaxID=364030 RepID=A0A238D490_THIDL|nr:hypothetical protein THIARS_60841 [Thiomonas delicata]
MLLAFMQRSVHAAEAAASQATDSRQAVLQIAGPSSSCGRAPNWPRHSPFARLDTPHIIE